MEPGTLLQIRQARNERARTGGSWDRIVELEKLNVRQGCEIEYRWLELTDTLIEAGRLQEALKALEEADARGFDLNPALIEQKTVTEFMNAPMFKKSALGVRFERLKRRSDARRARYREILNTMPPAERPPENYVATGACPFECCRFGDWTVLKATDVVAQPGSARVVGTAEKGTHVVAVTGEVHLRPEPVVVLKRSDALNRSDAFRNGELPEGSIAFILDPEGEGIGHVYTRGRIVSVFLGYADYCFRVSESCWGETLFPAKDRPPQVWWVKIQLANGIAGWTDKPEHFGGKDGCG